MVYGFKRPFRDGSTHVVLDPMSFLLRLAALVPPPRMHLVTDHGVLAGLGLLLSATSPPSSSLNFQARQNGDHLFPRGIVLCGFLSVVA